MKREDLRKLGIEGETLEKVIGLHGENVAQLVEAEKTLNFEKKQLQRQLDSRDEQLVELEKQLKSADDVDTKALTNELEALKEENERQKNEYTHQMSELKRKHAVERAVNQLPVRDAVYISDKLSDLELDEDGKLVDFDKRVGELKEQHPALFVDQNNTQPRWGTGGHSSASGGEITVEEIRKVKDRKERQRLIRENPDLFK